jgi:DNA-binding MarR family transcriptional regulator
MSLFVEFFSLRRAKLPENGQATRCDPKKGGGDLKMTPLAGYVGYALRRAQSVIFADLSQVLAPLMLRPVQFTVLLLIDQNPGTSQSCVSEALGIQKANFVATIADLEDRALIRRRKSESDARSYSLHLTARGRALLERAAELQSQHEARVIAQIGLQERLHLLDLLHRLAQLPLNESPKIAARPHPALPDSEQPLA